MTTAAHIQLFCRERGVGQAFGKLAISGLDTADVPVSPVVAPARDGAG